jgi:hypothetical protein
MIQNYRPTAGIASPDFSTSSTDFARLRGRATAIAQESGVCRTSEILIERSRERTDRRETIWMWGEKRSRKNFRRLFFGGS